MRLVAIPTRGSKIVLKILPEIANWADQVKLFATEVKFRESELPENVEVTYDCPELSQARDAGAMWARAEGATYIYQIDDDTSTDFGEALEAIEMTLNEYPFLGAVCTTPRLLAFYARDQKSNMDFRMVPSPTQIWGLRLSAYKETPGFHTVKTMEDIYTGLYMWRNGYATGTLDEFVHNHNRVRLSNDRVGGTPPSERDQYMPECMQALKSEFVGNVLKSISLSKTKKGVFKLSPRYNWSRMATSLRNRWGSIEYKDPRMEI